MRKVAGLPLPFLAGVSLSFAASLLSGTSNGLALASRDDSLSINDTTTAANNYNGSPANKLTTTRASTAMRWNASGLLESVATGTLRRDFDPRLASTPERCGYLIEEARTNSVLRSQEFGTTWTQSRATITSDAIAAPDGTTTADKLVEDSTAANDHRVFQAVTTTAAAWTFSVFAKAAERTWLALRMDDSGGVGRYGYFNLATGVVGTPGTGITQAIVSCGNGWYRCSVTIATAFAGASNPIIAIGEGDGDVTFNGDGASGLYIWGAQVELGSFASSYIPTTSATVTRAADLVTLAGTLFPLNTSEGTLYAKGMFQASGTTGALLVIDGGSNAEYVGIDRTAGNALRSLILDNSATQMSFTSVATMAALTAGRAALGYKLNDSAAAQLGETVQHDIVCTMPTPTTLVLGNRSTGLPINGWLFEAVYFPTRKTNSQLQYLASGYSDDAALLLGSESQGLTFSASDQTMRVLDTTTLANNYTGELSAKLGSIRTSSALTTLSSGLLGWGPENLFTRSQEFDNAVWSKDTGISVTADQIVAPDGTLTGDLITDDGSAASLMRVFQNLTLSSSTTFTYSVYAKQGSGRYILISASGLRWTGTGGSGVDKVCIFDLQTGAITATNTYTTAMTAVGNGWYRCSITLNSDNDAPEAGAVYIKQTTSPTSLVLPSTSQTVYLWGAQLERTSSASTYKPTTSAAYYGLRLDYDSRLTGGPGYLIEEARTNLVTQSNTLTNAAWTATRSSVAATETGMDGTTSAFFLKEDGTAASSHHLYNFNSITVVASTNYCLSAIVKQKTGTRRVRISCDVAAFTSGFDGTFNFASPANPTTGFYGTGTVVSSGYQDLGNGYYRIWVVGTLPSTSAVVGAYLHDGSGVSYNGDNTSGISIERFQFEAGSFPTSIIPTTTASVTRAADISNLSGTAFPMSTTLGTLAVSGTFMSPANAIQYALALSDGSVANMHGIRATVTSGAATFLSRASSADQASINSGTFSSLTNGKVAAGFASNDFGISKDGAAATTDVAGSVGVPTTLGFGLIPGNGNYMNGWLRHGRYYPRRATNTELATLSASA